MNRVVLDASAVLALLDDEPGAAEVAKALPGAVISAVNASEVMAKLADRGMPHQDVAQAFAILRIEVQPFDEEAALAAGMLRPRTRERGLSLGDRACLALGAKLGVPVLTGDRAWRGLKVGTEIRLLRAS